jgi:hypothetical protein
MSYSVDSINEHLLEKFDKVATEVAETKSTMQHVDTHNQMLDAEHVHTRDVSDVHHKEFIAWKRKMCGTRESSAKISQPENTRRDMLSA